MQLNRLATERLQDDGRFAESYINHRAGRGYGPLKIRAELRMRGVDEAVTNRSFEMLDIDWDERAEGVWRKKFSDAPKNFSDYAKQARFLQYRGFSSDQVARILNAEHFA